LVAATHGVRLLDLNFRPPYIEATTIESSLSLANVVKLNEEELLTTRDLLPSRLGKSTTVDELAARLLQAYELEFVALTRGARGTVLYTANGRLEGQFIKIDATADADSVGAGDACCAALLYGVLHDWPLARTVELANRMGAYVASQPSGTPKLSSDVLDFARAAGRSIA
jgi:fructokinase